MTINVHTGDTCQADFSIVNTAPGQSAVGVIKTNVSTADYETLSRDDLRWWSAGTQFYVSSPSFAGQFWYWGGFNLAGLMNPLIAFSVYHTSSVISPSSTQPFPFSNVAVNEGAGWNHVSHKFVAPRSGSYFFSFTVASEYRSAAQFYMVIDNNVTYNAEVSDTNSPGIDVATRSLAVNLSAGASVWITGNTTRVYSDVYQLASFKGFYYAPVHGVAAIWMAYTTKDSTTPNAVQPYDAITVSVGATWLDTMRVQLLNAGLYYVAISSTLKYVTGIFSEANIQLKVNYVNTYDLFTHKQTRPPGPSFSGYVTRSASVIKHFNAGDILYVNPNGGFIITYSSFSGFLLYP